MKHLKAAALVVALVVVGSGSAFAQSAFQVVPFEFDPDNACDLTAEWQNGTLVLAKNCATATNAAAGADIISPLEGQDISNLTELNFDVMNGGHCGAGAPRFNVTVDGSTYFLGCTQGTHTDLGNGWTHVEFTTTDFAAAGIPATGTLEDLMIIFDEGTDTPTGGTIGTAGSVTIDNISVNGDEVGDSAKPTSVEQCKYGGWRNFQDPSFRNQGQCVSYVVSHRGGNGKSQGNH
jgi:hypothetical protein